MLADILLPDSSQLRFASYQLEDGTLYMNIHASQSQACCPSCGSASTRVHSTYTRTLADLPCLGWQVRLCWTVRRFFCDNPECPRKTFAEQLPDVAARYARRTQRLAECQRRIAFETGGELGRRIWATLGLSVSGDQLLRLIRQTPCGQGAVPQVLGIDDWAFRKRHTYGTILVDMERHCVVDLLPDRDAATVAQCLQQHPEVTTVCRDRGQVYIDGVTAGAPQTVQIADRFHLLRNLYEVLIKVCERRSLDLKAVTQELAASAAAESAAQAPESAVRLSPREQRFQQVKQLQSQGLSQRAVAREVGLDRRTIARYFRLQHLPSRAPTPQTQSAASAYLPYLMERWDAGCSNRRQLFEEIQAQGFTGSYASVWRATRYLSPQSTGSSQLPERQPYAARRNAAWLLMCPETKLTDDEQRTRTKLREHSAPIDAAYTLAQAFWRLFHEPGELTLDTWLAEAESGPLPEFKRFAKSLRSDYQAVKEATTSPWSSGQVEGQVQRLKLIKRQMYGRAKFDLLRQRVIGLT